MARFKIKLAGYDHWKQVVLTSLPRSCGCDGSLEQALEDELREQLGIPIEEKVEILAYRRLEEVVPVGVTVLRVVQSYQSYGGPEEGGWWYSTEELDREFWVPTSRAKRCRERLEAYAERQNEGLREWDRDGRTYVRTGRFVGQSRPHYC